MSCQGPSTTNLDPVLHSWCVALVLAGLAAIAPATWWWRGDPAAVGLPGRKAWSWQRLRPTVTGGLVAFVALPFALISSERLAELLDVSWRTLVSAQIARNAIIGGMTLAAAVILTILAGLAAGRGADRGNRPDRHLRAHGDRAPRDQRGGTRTLVRGTGRRGDRRDRRCERVADRSRGDAHSGCGHAPN